MRIGTWFMIACAFIAEPLSAQSGDPPTVLVSHPIQFASWRPDAMSGDLHDSFSVQLLPLVQRQERNALIGGAIGTVAGLAFCTVVSNLIKDPGSGFSTCTLKGYLLFGSIGLATGLVIGLTI